MALLMSHYSEVLHLHSHPSESNTVKYCSYSAVSTKWDCIDCAARENSNNNCFVYSDWSVVSQEVLKPKGANFEAHITAITYKFLFGEAVLVWRCCSRRLVLSQSAVTTLWKWHFLYVSGCGNGNNWTNTTHPPRSPCPLISLASPRSFVHPFSNVGLIPLRTAHWLWHSPF